MKRIYSIQLAHARPGTIHALASYLFMLQVFLHVFKVVVSGSLIAFESGESLSGFLTESNHISVAVK